MFDASVALLAKIGVPRVKFLEYLKEMLIHRNFFTSGARTLQYIQRGEGVNPDVLYTVALTSAAPVYATDVDPVFTVSLVSPLTGLFIDKSVTFVPGTTDLTLGDTALSVGGDEITVNTTGTAVAGTLSVKVSSDSTINGKSSHTASYIIYESEIYDPAVLYELATATVVAVDAVDPSIVVTVDAPVGGLFVDGAETLENWTIDAGTTDLTIASATLNGAKTELTFAFTGTAVAGEITISGNENVVANGAVPDPLIYTIA